MVILIALGAGALVVELGDARIVSPAVFDERTTARDRRRFGERGGENAPPKLRPRFVERDA